MVSTARSSYPVTRASHRPQKAHTYPSRSYGPSVRSRSIQAASYLLTCFRRFPRCMVFRWYIRRSQQPCHNYNARYLPRVSLEEGAGIHHRPDLRCLVGSDTHLCQLLPRNRRIRGRSGRTHHAWNRISVCYLRCTFLHLLSHHRDTNSISSSTTFPGPHASSTSSLAHSSSLS